MEVCPKGAVGVPKARAEAGVPETLLAKGDWLCPCKGAVLVPKGDGAGADVLVPNGDGAGAKVLVPNGDGAEAGVLVANGDGAGAGVLVPNGDGDGAGVPNGEVPSGGF